MQACSLLYYHFSNWLSLFTMPSYFVTSLIFTFFADIH